MGIESFNYRKPALSSAPDVQLVGQMYGTLVDQTQRSNAPGDSIQPAGLFSTAPYTGPGAAPQPQRPTASETTIRRVSDGVRVINGRPRCKANDDTCMGLAYSSEYCLGHRKALAKEQSSTSKD
jgi:hypothetical protein